MPPRENAQEGDIQAKYDELIRGRDPRAVRAYWQEVGVLPDQERLSLILKVGKRVQEVMDLRGGSCFGPFERNDNDKPTEPDHWNLYMEMVHAQRAADGLSEDSPRTQNDKEFLDTVAL